MSSLISTEKTGDFTEMRTFDLLLIGYRMADTIIAIRFCDRMFGKHQIGRKILMLNREMDALSLPDNTWEIVRGSNRLGEFSGWQEGIELLRSAKTSSQGIVFVNDSICTHRHFTYFREKAFIKTLAVSNESSITGFRDDAPEGSSILGLATPSWVSTYCFALTAPALEALNWKVFDEQEVSTCVPGGTDEAAFLQNMSAPLSEHIQRWLFKEGWYGAEPLTAQNERKFERKAKSIVSEILLTSRCMSLHVVAHDPFIEHERLALLDRIYHRIVRLIDHTLS